VNTYPALHGGFIWEWIDHGLVTTDAEGNTIFGYGGDFGERLHDGNFVADGLVLPDRSPSPALIDAKHHYSPVGLEVAGGEAGAPATVILINRYSFRDLSHLRAELSVDGQQTWSELELPAARPGESVTVELPGSAAAAVVTVRLVTREVEGPVPAGHLVVAADAVDRSAVAAGLPRVGSADAGAISVGTAKADAGVTGVPGRGWKVGPAQLDDLGHLVALGGVSVEHAGVDLYRAPVDNERADTHPKLEARWKAIGLDVPRFRLASAEVEEGELVLVKRLGLDGSSLGADVTERWSSDGTTVALDVSVVPRANWPEDLPLPRVGWTFALPGDYDQVEYTGYGPHESYPDTGGGVTFATRTSSVADLQVPYVFPQENGNRAGVVRAVLSGADVGEAGPAGSALQLVAPEGLGLAVRPWSTAELDATAHDGALKPEGKTWVTLSAALHGVGSAACGPAPLPQYVLTARPVDFHVEFSPSASRD
jgi:beta-galactosidase